MATVAQYVTDITTHLNDIGASVDGIVADVAKLNATIAQLQATQGQLTPEDEALLTTITSLGASLKDKAKAADDLTAPDEVPEPPVV